jgi:hypothetical protein
MPKLAGIFSKKDKHTHTQPNSPTKSSAAAAGPSTIRVVDDPNKSTAQSPFTSEPTLPIAYVLPEISLLSADNGAPDDAVSITASSSSVHPHPPSSSVATSSSSVLRLINPFRKKSPNGHTQCESFSLSIPGPASSYRV